MTVNLATAVYKATGSTTGRSLGARAADILNVQDYGAVGDGSHDDTTNIQATLDTAFGPWNGTQNGNANKALNKAVFFPNGNYKITSPLYLVNIVGGLIFGAGQGATTISYGGTFAGGNAIAPSPGDVFVPIFMMNGFSYSCIRDMSLSSPASGGSFLGVGCYLYQAPSAPHDFSQTQVLFQNMRISADTGVLAGYPGSSVECSECQYVGVTFSNCAFAGLTTGASNALNHSVYGGGAFSCARGYNVQAGNINLICDASLGGNTTIDIISDGASAGSPMVVTGCRTESNNFLSISANQIYVSGCEQATAAGKSFLASTGATAILDACSSSGGTNNITGTGTLYLRGCAGFNTGGYSGTIAQNI